MLIMILRGDTDNNKVDNNIAENENADDIANENDIANDNIDIRNNYQ